MDFNEVLRSVRSYRNGHGDPVPYDLNGVVHLIAPKVLATINMSPIQHAQMLKTGTVMNVAIP